MSGNSLINDVNESVGSVRPATRGLEIRLNPAVHASLDGLSLGSEFLQGASIQSQGVTDVVEANGMRQVANISAIIWLQALKVRSCSATPVSRASFGTKCGGIRLLICRRMVYLETVGMS